MTSSHIKDGQIAEQLAYDYLISQKLTCITRNYRSRTGEIDLIMKKEPDTIIFTEVRYRKHSDINSGTASINKAKQTKLVKAAQFYLQQKKLLNRVHVRFDIVSFDREINLQNLTWLPNAFYPDQFYL